MAFTETVPYEVLNEDKPFELRRYEPFLIAAARTPLDRRHNGGFNTVFQYISGANREQTKISMTTPVVTNVEDGKLMTGFYVPSKYDRNNVPQPTNNVTIDEVPGGLYLVVRFSGSWDEGKFAKQDEQLQAYIRSRGYEIIGNRYVLRYQPPFVPGFLRRNEIMYQVKTVLD